MVNQSTDLANSVATALLQVGAQDVVVCPGSRSAPLAWQFAQLASENRIRLHTRIDEREAGFLALGLAKVNKQPVAVVVTSGTAVANLLPAVVEAHHSGVPLVILSADRPAKFRGKSAPQTTWQVDMFKNFVKAIVDTEKPTDEILTALKLATVSHCGPIHINTQFDFPLMPDNVKVSLPSLEGEQFSQKNIFSENANPVEMELPAKGILIVGDIFDSSEVEKLEQLAITSGYPIIWEPTSQLHKSTQAISHGALLLQSGKTIQPDVVITAGLVGLSRSVLGLLKSATRHIAIHLPSSGNELPDPVLSAEEVLTGIPKVHTQVDSEWLNYWKQLDRVASEIISKNLSGQRLNGPTAAVTLWRELENNSNLMIASSWPVRHIEMYGEVRSGLTTFGNRGVNGIDGLISTAVGIALNSTSRTYLLIGDIAFLHSMSGLNISEPNLVPNLTVIVLDNDGSGIFSQLEQGSEKYQQHFESVFGTPHGKDLWVISESLGIPASRLTTKSELIDALARTKMIAGMHVLVCNTGSRSDEQALITAINEEVTTSI